MVFVLLTNRFAYINSASDEELSKLSDFWSFYSAKAHFTPSHQLWIQERIKAKRAGDPNRKCAGWDGRIRLLKRGKVPAGLFRATRKEIKDTLGIQFRVKLHRPDIQPYQPGFVVSDPKYSYQNDCTQAMLKALPRGGGIVLAATRTGKTATASQFFSKLPYSCLFVVDQLDLLDQSQQELAYWLHEEVGYIGDAIYDPKRVTVATRQTLSQHLNEKKFMDWYEHVEVVIVDELHEALNDSNFSILEAIKPIARYGLTATLQLQKKEINLRAYAFAGPLIFSFPIEEGVKRGVLTKGRVVQLLFEPVPIASDGYQEEYRHQVVEHEVKAKAIKSMIELLLSSGRYVVLLTDRVLHVKGLSTLFEKTDHRLAYGAVEKIKRAAARASMDDGSLRLIIANKVWRKGITIKRVDAMIDCAEMKDKNTAVQKFGRGIGLHPDKTDLIYIDIGTDGKNRFHKAARSRARAWRSDNIEVKTIRVSSADHAVKTLQKELMTSREKKCE
jgi:superfamily II DNA or RNA helicase